MTTFAQAVLNQEARTVNGMKARKSTAKSNVDLFYKIGASRGKNIIPDFVAGLAENKDVALRIAQWARDIRQGAGERQIFRDILLYLDKNDPDTAVALLYKVPELGRYDDLLLPFQNEVVKSTAYSIIGHALKEGNGLAAKWMPRKGPQAVFLRRFFGLTPKSYRKMLVELTNVVESQMCKNDWDNINFNHVPSLASSRYKKAFNRHTKKYGEYVAALVSKDPKVRETVKVNAGAVYPYDVLKGFISLYMNNSYGKNEKDHIKAQWEALPDYMGGQKVLPLVDVSGSMTSPVGHNSNLTCLDVSVSLGLYCAEKNKGVFKDTFLTFSGTPELLHLKGDIIQKAEQMVRSTWQMNTNLHAALRKILTTAKDARLPQDEMPNMLLILSDMQFDACVTRERGDSSAMEMIREEYANAGYKAPEVVFWNLNSYDNVPVKYDERGAALVSGFSPSILKSVLSADMDNFTPEGIMLKTLMNPRYDLDIEEETGE